MHHHHKADVLYVSICEGGRGLVPLELLQNSKIVLQRYLKTAEDSICIKEHERNKIYSISQEMKKKKNGVQVNHNTLNAVAKNIKMQCSK